MTRVMYVTESHILIFTLVFTIDFFHISRDDRRSTNIILLYISIFLIFKSALVDIGFPAK